MPCPECPETPDTGCLHPITTECVTYNGNDVDCANIASGQTLNQVIEQLANNDCDLQEQIEDIVQDIQELSGNVNDLQDSLEELSGSVQTQINNIPSFTCEDLSGCSLDDLSDVDISPVSGDNLIFNGIKWVTYQPEDYQFTCEELSGCTLDELSGVTITNAVSGDVIIHNGSQFINFPVNQLLADLQNSINVLNTQLDIQNNAITLLNIRMDECSCSSGLALDVDLLGSEFTLCYENGASNGKLIISPINVVGTGADYFEDITHKTKITMVSVTAPAAAVPTVVHALVPERNNGGNFNFSLNSGIKAELMSGGGGGTITFYIKFHDASLNLHVATISATIPTLISVGSDCIPSPIAITSFEIDAF